LYTDNTYSGEINSYFNHYIRTKNKISISNYSKLTAVVTKSSGWVGSPVFGISTDGVTALEGVTINGTTGTFDLDVSSYTGEYYIGFFARFTHYGNEIKFAVTTTSIKLQP